MGTIVFRSFSLLDNSEGLVLLFFRHCEMFFFSEILMSPKGPLFDYFDFLHPLKLRSTKYQIEVRKKAFSRGPARYFQTFEAFFGDEWHLLCSSTFFRVFHENALKKVWSEIRFSQYISTDNFSLFEFLTLNSNYFAFF